ncbi:MAG: hypothetical protein AB1473_17100 [Thermodesulfobacteriota bacterium]
MRRNLCKVLVCLALVLAALTAAHARDHTFIRVNVDPQQASLFKAQEPLRGTGNASSSLLPSLVDSDATFEPASARVPRLSGSRAHYSSPRPIVKCKGPVCPLPVPVCAPPPPPCKLPRRMCGQFELATQVFFARTKGTVRYPAVVLGFPATEIDLNNDLGFPEHATVLEYSARYQFRPNWAFFYSIMPFDETSNKTIENSIYFGGQFIPTGCFTANKWQFVYQRVGMLYSPIQTCSSSLSITGGWLYNDSRVSVNSAVCGGTGNQADRTRNMVVTGVELQKCIKTMCNQATFSCDDQISLGWGDGSFMLDLQVGFRFTVPMNCGRWGYAKGGYRLLQFNESRDDLKLDFSLEGGFVEAGLIF